MLLNRRAGNFASVDKFIHAPTGEPGYTIHCRLCRTKSQRWSTRTVVKRAMGGKRNARGYYNFQDMMDLWALHMQLHHPKQEQPDWSISEDLDPVFAEVEAKFFERTETAEERRLREILGLPSREEVEQSVWDRERELAEVRKQAKRLGHQVHLPARKTPGVWAGSQGWVCTCGASGMPDTLNDTGLVQSQARQHLRDMVSSEQGKEMLGGKSSEPR